MTMKTLLQSILTFTQGKKSKFRPSRGKKKAREKIPGPFEISQNIYV
jgi:hypothetical protein